MTSSSWLLPIAALAGVIGFIYLIQHLLRLVPNRLAAPRGGRLQPLTTLALDPRRRLHLVRCDDRQVLLLTGGAQDLVVGWLASPPTEPAP